MGSESPHSESNQRWARNSTGNGMAVWLGKRARNSTGNSMAMWVGKMGTQQHWQPYGDVVRGGHISEGWYIEHLEAIFDFFGGVPAHSVGMVRGIVVGVRKMIVMVRVRFTFRVRVRLGLPI